MSKRRRIQPSSSSSSSTATAAATAASTATAATAASEYSDDEDDLQALRRATQISDTHAAIRSLLSDFPAEGGLSPFSVVLKHQIYTIVTNRSSVEKELDHLIQEKVVRRFDSATGRSECFICLNDDYVKYMTEWSSAEHTKKNPLATLIQTFCDLALLNKSISITRADLELELGTTDIDDLVRLLTSQGFLTIQTQRLNVECYLFSIPLIGRVVKNVLMGRKEILGVLKRKKFRELLQSKLLALPLKTSCMRTSSIIRDLVGNGTVISTPTTSGPLIRMKSYEKKKKR